MTVGQTVAATATTRDASGATLTGRTVTWTSSNPSVAVVNASGVVTAVSAGSAQVQATSEGVSASATLSVTNPPPPTVAVNNLVVTVSTTTLNPTQTLTATAYPRDAANAVLTGRTVTWASSNPAVATVSSEGLITAVSLGTATITATSEGKSGSVAMTVALPKVANVVVTTPSSVLRVGQSFTATAWVRDAANSVLQGRVVTWSSNNVRVATVSATGVVTGVSPGSVKITATSEGKRAAVSLTVIR